MVDLDETDLPDPEKAFRAQALVADINVTNYDDPEIKQLQGEAIDLLDNLASELQATGDE